MPISKHLKGPVGPTRLARGRVIRFARTRTRKRDAHPQRTGEYASGVLARKTPWPQDLSAPRNDSGEQGELGKAVSTCSAYSSILSTAPGNRLERRILKRRPVFREAIFDIHAKLFYIPRGAAFNDDMRLIQ